MIGMSRLAEADAILICVPTPLSKSRDPDLTFVENTARAMGDAPKEIKVRHIGNCMKADPAYGEGVAKALGIPMSEPNHSIADALYVRHGSHRRHRS